MKELLPLLVTRISQPATSSTIGAYSPFQSITANELDEVAG